MKSRSEQKLHLVEWRRDPYHVIRASRSPTTTAPDPELETPSDHSKETPSRKSAIHNHRTDAWDKLLFSSAFLESCHCWILDTWIKHHLREVLSNRFSVFLPSSIINPKWHHSQQRNRLDHIRSYRRIPHERKNSSTIHKRIPTGNWNSLAGLKKDPSSSCPIKLDNIRETESRRDTPKQRKIARIPAKCQWISSAADTSVIKPTSTGHQTDTWNRQQSSFVGE